MKSAFVKLMATATLFSLPAQSIAAECVTQDEARDLVLFAMPEALSGLIDHCKPHVAKGGFFETGGNAMVEKYRTTSGPAWPNARNAFFKLGNADGKLDSIKKMPDEGQKGVINLGLQMAVSQLKTDSCTRIERVTGALAPLPPENTAFLVGELIAIGMASGAKKEGKPKFNMCPTPSIAAKN